jgi:hypothetical protein
MIELEALTGELAGLIHRETGLFAVSERLRTAVYPSIFVEGREAMTTIIAGGRQVLRRVEMQVTCLPDREREGAGVRDMAFQLYGVLLPWFSVCGRRFAPESLESAGEFGEQVRFALEFCDLPPERETGRNTKAMDRLELALGE